MSFDKTCSTILSTNLSVFSPGSHMDDERQTGYAGLGASVAALGHGTKSAIEVDLVV